MASAFDTGILRSIRGSLGRFVAIAAIVALGAGFYAGLRMTCPDMKLAADEWYDDTALMDIRVVSSLGLTDDDVAALREVEGVAGVMGAYEVDILAEAGGEGYAMRVHSLPEAALSSDTSDGVSALSDDGDYLNRPILTAGRWPEATGECVISSDIVIGADVQIGDVIVVTEVAEGSEDVLVSSEFLVVGTVSSSYYATSSNMGTTSLGSGSIQDYLYVCEDEFADDTPYTEIFLTVEGAAELNSSTASYDELVEEVEERIEAIAEARAAARTDEVVGDAQEQVDEGWADYDAERADAEDELADAQAQLDDAAEQMADAQAQIDAGWADYDEGVAELAASRAEAEAELAAAEEELDAAQEELDEALAARAELAEQLEEAEENLAAVDEGIDSAQATLDELNATLEQLSAALAAAQAAAGATDAAATATDDAATATDATLDATAALYAAQIAELEEGVASAEAALSELESTREQLLDAVAQLEAGIAAIDEQTDGADEQIAAGRAELEEQRASAEAQLAEAQAALDEAAAELEQAESDLAEAQADYDEGAAELADARVEADESFADAEAELADAQEQVDAIEAAEWYVMDRDENYGVASFEADAERIDSIAQVFPFIFFLVAALVALTTMTRMVEEERVVIGTYKALGYSRGRIAWKYLAYALSASVLGCVVGILVLSQVLPAVIMYAYAIIYFVPRGGLLPVDVPLALLAAGLSIGVTALSTVAAVYATLRERPAALMLPRVPKAGKRILLERVGPLWRRLSFSWKVTCRNMFRYKKRLVMTVVGIAGCTALLLCGLGLSDAINDIIDKQFYDILRYNATIVTEEDMDDASAAELEALLADDAYVSDSMRVGRVTMSATSEAVGGDTYQKAQIVAVSDPDRFGDFVDLRTREGAQAIELGEDGVVLSEKLADQLELSVGDVLRLVEQDTVGNPTGEVHELTVTGIAENYVYYYVYLGPEAWESLMGDDAVFESVYAVCSTDEEVRDAFSEQVRAIDGVSTVSYMDETVDTYKSMIASVNLIVVVLVVAAAALAFIVVYNLTNINITERVREIATLKVLGFTRGEMEAYIFRETILLSVVGAALGLFLGVYLESFVVVTAEVNQVMFGREIHAASFALAFVLTIAFTAFVMFVMRRKISSVSMVESLKSNE